MIKVYIASPYLTSGDVNENVIQHLKAGKELIDAGFAPYAPLLNHFFNMLYPQTEEKWLELDLEYLSICNCLLRLEGESKGADIEVECAVRKGMEVFHTVQEVINRYTFVRIERNIMPMGF
jgi:hypothetical protein